jgi:hypothetical protein
VAKPAPVKQKQKPRGDPLWKRQHMDFINSIRYARKITKAQEQGIDLRTLAPPPAQFADPTAGYVQCPYCQRKYAPAPAERHIPACANIVNKPKAPPKRASLPTRPVVPQRQPAPAAPKTQANPQQSLRTSQSKLAPPSPQSSIRTKAEVRVKEEAKRAPKVSAGRQSEVKNSCNTCGESLAATARFCGYCGSRK